MSFFPTAHGKCMMTISKNKTTTEFVPRYRSRRRGWRPKRGFGTVWCNVAEVQALGPGLEEEHAAEITVQKFTRAQLWYIPKRGAIIVWNDGTWE